VLPFDGEGDILYVAIITRYSSSDRGTNAESSREAALTKQRAVVKAAIEKAVHAPKAGPAPKARAAGIPSWVSSTE